MGRLVGMAVVGLGFLLAAGCECACVKKACVVPERIREEITVNTVSAESPSVERVHVKNQI